MPFRLADAIFWIAVACCAVAQVAILHSVLKSPSSASSSATGAPAPISRRATEVAWAVIPGFALAAVLVFTWRAMR